MDQLSTHELRGAAVTANLRRAFGAPVEADLPTAFAVLLGRLGESRQPSSPPVSPALRDPHRLRA